MDFILSHIGYFAAAFGLGIVSNLHCVGMCGPIALALPLNRRNNWTASGGIMIYSVARGLGYAILGIIVGTIGMTADLIGVLQWLSVGAGLMIMLFAWKGYYNFSPKLASFNQKVTNQLKKQFQHKGRGNKKLFSFGFVNAFLPCGMVYFALIGAMSTGSMLAGGMYMFVFALGTAPGFIALAIMKNRFSGFGFFSKKMVVASLITIVGAGMVLRGLNLGIPYISPKMEIVQANQELNDDNNEVILSCCSKKNQEENAECVAPSNE
jgi:sulfite exporter TauE/SafE